MLNSDCGDKMDFFNVGFVLCALNFNFDWLPDYALKLIGAGFMAGGVRELALYYGDDRFGRHRKGIVLLALISAAGTALTLFLHFGMISADTGNILCTAAGFAGGGTVIAGQWLILRQLMEDRTLVNDPSLLRRLGAAWKRYAVFAGISLIAEAVGRFAVTDSIPHLASGLILVPARVIMYICAIDMGAAFNRCRMDFNKIHPAEE